MQRKKTRRSQGYSVHKLPDGRWRAAVTVGYNENGNPKRVTVTKKTERDVREALEELIARKRRNEPLTDNRQKLEDFMTWWLEETVAGKKAPKTERSYRQMTGLYIVPALGRVELGKLGPQQLQTFFNDLAKTPRPGGKLLSACTVRNVKAVLRAALNEACFLKHISANPVLMVKVPARSVSDRQAKYLTIEEVKALLEVSRGHYLGGLFALAVSTGLRLGEATGLTWADVETDTIVVRRQLQWNGNGHELRDLKTKSASRRVPLVAKAREAIERQRGNQELWASAHGDDFNTLGLVFTNTTGTPLHQSNVNKHLKALARQAGIAKNVSFHILRHTAGTYLVAAGVELNHVKEILGHSQLSITADLYAHAVPSTHKAALDRLGAALS